MALNKFFHVFIPLLTTLCLCGIAQSGSDQKGQDKYLQLKAMIESKHYYFHANSATSMKGRTIQLTSEYFLKMNNDSLLVDLPYYGRAYSSDYPGTDIAYQFTSTQFSYVIDTTKNGGWEIAIVPKNESKASKIYLSISSAGYCTLRINSNSRQAISYYGTITAYDAH